MKKYFTKGFYITWAVLTILPGLIFYLGAIGSRVGFTPLSVLYDLWFFLFFGNAFGLIMAFWTTRAVLMFFVALGFKRWYNTSKSFSRFTDRLVKFLISKTFIIGIVVIAVLSTILIFYNLNLQRASSELGVTTDEHCKKMFPGDSKGECYLDLAVATGDLSYCENAGKWQGCWQVAAEKSTLDTDLGCSHAGHRNSCIRDVMNSVGSVMSKKLNKEDFCLENSSEDICISPNITAEMSGDKLQINLRLISKINGDIYISSNICDPGSNFKPVQCSHRSNNTYPIISGENNVQLFYPGGADRTLFLRGGSIEIKFIKVDLPDKSFVGVQEYRLEIPRKNNPPSEYFLKAMNRLKGTMVENFALSSPTYEECLAIRGVYENVYGKRGDLLNTEVFNQYCLSKIKDCSTVMLNGAKHCIEKPEELNCDRDFGCGMNTAFLDRGLPRFSTGVIYSMDWAATNGNTTACMDLEGSKDNCLGTVGGIWLDCNACDLIDDLDNKAKCKQLIKDLSKSKILCS